jgi:hypothetical protein
MLVAFKQHPHQHRPSNSQLQLRGTKTIATRRDQSKTIPSQARITALLRQLRTNPRGNVDRTAPGPNGSGIPPERQLEVQRRIGRDHLPPRYLGLQIRPEEVKLLTEVGRLRVITARDLSETVYRGQKGQLSRDLQFLRDKDLISTDFVNARRDGRLKKVERIEVVTLTRTGRALVRQSGELRPDQEVYAGLVKRREVEHDSQIYRAYLKEAGRIERLGGKNPRIALDFELKAKVQRAIYHERKANPERDLQEIRQQVADEIKLPVVDGQIQIPDARIEYELDQGARTAFSDIEVATAAYRPGHLRAKAQAGFRIYASSRDRSRLSAQIEGEHHMLDRILDL